MPIYTVSDESGHHEHITAESAEAAAQRYVDTGSRDTDRTMFHHIRVVDEDSNWETVTIIVDADEPSCVADEHDWQSPYEIVGGCETNPGVWGHGGGVRIDEVCLHCGCGRVTDTWATDPGNGSQGHTTVEYEEGRYVEALSAVSA